VLRSLFSLCFIGPAHLPQRGNDSRLIEFERDNNVGVQLFDVVLRFVQLGQKIGRVGCSRFRDENEQEEEAKEEAR
jgi:hypothetical protein